MMAEKAVLLGLTVIVVLALAYAARTYLTPAPLVGGSCGTVSPYEADECCARQNANTWRAECVGGWKYITEKGVCEYVCGHIKVSNFAECVEAGNPVMESYPRQCRTADGRTFTEVIDRQSLSEDICEGAGGHWNTCSNKCTLMAQGKTGVACTMQCETLCECGGIAGYRCPQGYNCVTPDGVIDALGYCAQEREGPADGLTYSQAREIAGKSDCISVGALKDTHLHNPNTRTWWIDLDADKPGCNPACVVSEKTRTAEINWRCTGLIIPDG